MDVAEFIEKKEIKIDANRYLISKIPAVQAQEIYGDIMRECKEDGDIAMTYLSRPTMQKLLAYAAVPMGDNWKVLETDNDINSACPDMGVLVKLEAEMIRYNFSFLFDGSLQKVLGVLRGREDI